MGSGGGFGAEVDLGVVSGFDFEAMTPVDFGGRGLEVGIVDGGGIAATFDEDPATMFGVATGTDKRR